jgi:hypothetical protein
MRAMTRRALGLKENARHVIGCLFTQDMDVQNACDDKASTVHQSLPQRPIRPSGFGLCT